jgi:hypothetical protein
MENDFTANEETIDDVVESLDDETETEPALADPPPAAPTCAPEPTSAPAVTALANAKPASNRAAVLASLANQSAFAGSAATHLDRAAASREYLAEFGERGAVYFAEGRSLSEARSCFANDLKAENERLQKQLENLTARLSMGELEPATFGSAKSASADELTKLASKTTGPGIAKLAASIKLPSEKNERD